MTELVANVRESSREMVRELGFLEDIYAECRIPHSQCHALMELERHGELLPGDLSRLLRLDKSTTSRIVSGIVKAGWARHSASADDRRRKPLALTKKGRAKLEGIHRGANARVGGALSLLSESDRATVGEGLRLYARALEKSRRLAPVAIRPLRKSDDASVARVIRTVMPEFGAHGPGFAIHDPEVAAMSETYRGDRSRYFVAEKDRVVIGGAGVAPLAGGDDATCELRKMYVLPEGRGCGLGQRLLDTCLAAARDAGFARCYLETLKHMTDARRLYDRNGFREIAAPMGATGHFGCDAWYVKEL